MVILESIRQKLPVIVFQCCAALSDIAVDGGNSVFVPPFSIRRFARELDDLMKNQDRRTAMENYDQSYLGKFCSEQVRLQWENLFKRLKNVDENK